MKKKYKAGADGLTPRERLFVHAYALTLAETNGKGNGKQAAISIGCPPASAATRASNFLKMPHVQSAISQLMDMRTKKFDISAEKILQELAKLGFSNMRDYLVFGADGSASVDWSKMTEEQAAAIQEVTIETYPERTGVDADGKPTFETVKRIKFRLHDKKGALDSLGKSQKLFTEGVALQNPDGSPIAAPLFQVVFTDKP